jgi:hypothetical protein
LDCLRLTGRGEYWNSKPKNHKRKIAFMKTSIQKFICILGLTFLVLFTVMFWSAGCATRIPDPLMGWHLCFSQDPNKLDHAIRDDYLDYIQKLPPKERNYVGDISFLEDGTGQRAVSIEIFANNKSASWRYALIYDKRNMRVEVIKYGYRRHMS